MTMHMEKSSKTCKEVSLFDLFVNHWSNLIFHIHEESRGCQSENQRSSQTEQDVRRFVLHEKKLGRENVEGS